MLSIALRHGLYVALFFATAFATSAKILDNFDDNTKTAWQDFLFPVGVQYATITEQSGQLNFSLIPVGQSIFAASTKTSETFELKEGRTIEYRVDLVSGNGQDAFAILAFIPTTSTVQSLGGYGFAKSTTDILVTKALDKYFYNENPTTPIKNENITMVLSLTVKNGSVIINSKVLDKDANNAVLFEKTFIDTTAADVLADGTDNIPPYLGAGNFVLMCYEDNGTTQASYEVTFDNAEVFVTESTIVDDFNDNTKTAWQDFLFPVGVQYANITEANGQLGFNLIPVGQSIFAASTKTSRTYDLVDGERVEFSVDLVSGNGQDAFAILSFTPTTSSVQSLNGYGFAKSTTDILVTKGLDKYFYNENPPTPIKNENVTMVLSLTARGQTVTINAKVLDKDANNAVIFEKTFVDTPGADVLSDGTDNGPAYLGSGHFVLLCYEDAGTTQASYEVYFDNAMASAAPAAANTPPVISNVSIEPSANFLPAATQLSFTVADNAPVVDSRITVTLNGQALTSANGLTFSGPADARVVTLGNLSANTPYTITIEASDAENATARTTFTFDTFSLTSYVIEIEDYNFGGGQFIDNPVPIAEGSGPQSNGYANQTGTKGIDYNDTRTNFSDVPYRPEDNVRMQHSLDFPRAKFLAAGGPTASVFDYDVGDIAAGEWLNYTRTFPAGTYEVYLREALRNGTQVETVLEEVTSSPGAENQTTRVLGSFITTTSGFQFRNIPLSDAVGNKISLALSGVKTLRLRQVSGDPSDGAIYQNYLIFIPVSGTGTQRATISSLNPAPGAAIKTVTPRIEATFLNRDTSVRVSSIRLLVGGLVVTPVITTTTDGATLSYALPTLPPSGSTVAAQIEFTDSQDAIQTNQWSFTLTYNSLDPANRAGGSGQDRGIKLRMVQAPIESSPLENSLLRADEQLAANSTIPKFVDTNVVVQVVNFNQFEADAGEIPGDQIVPGLEPDGNGTEDFAVDLQGYLELTQGIHRFGVNTDDGYKITFGTSPTDQATTPMAFRSGGPANETFDFVVPASGLYPFRLVWYERGGGAHAEFTSVDPQSGAKTLINDPATPSAIKVFTAVSAPSIRVESSTNVTTGFTTDASATVDAAAGRISIPLPGQNRFYRLSGTVRHQITESRVSGNTLVLTFQVAN